MKRSGLVVGCFCCWMLFVNGAPLPRLTQSTLREHECAIILKDARFEPQGHRVFEVACELMNRSQVPVSLEPRSLQSSLVLAVRLWKANTDSEYRLAPHFPAGEMTEPPPCITLDPGESTTISAKISSHRGGFAVRDASVWTSSEHEVEVLEPGTYAVDLVMAVAYQIQGLGGEQYVLCRSQNKRWISVRDAKDALEGP